VAQGLGDGREDTLSVREDVVVPEAQRAVAVRGEPGVARRVAWAVGELATVELDDQLRIKASEVSDVRADRALLAEVEAIDLLAPQVLPKAHLSVGRLGT
jgi:hypothetical protein